MKEVENWKQFNNPLSRLRGYMEHRGLWTQVPRGGARSVRRGVATDYSMQSLPLELDVCTLFRWSHISL